MSKTQYSDLPKQVFPSFGTSNFTNEERIRIQGLLEKQLDDVDVLFHTGSIENIVPYVAVSTIIDRANTIFGVNAWSCQITSLEQNLVEKIEDKVMCAYSATIKVTLKDGSFREDVGFGCTTSKSMSEAIMKSEKIAISDGLKRAMRLFGAALGNTLSDREYMNQFSSRIKRRSYEEA